MSPAPLAVPPFKVPLRVEESAYWKDAKVIDADGKIVLVANPHEVAHAIVTACNAYYAPAADVVRYTPVCVEKPLTALQSYMAVDMRPDKDGGYVEWQALSAITAERDAACRDANEKAFTVAKLRSELAAAREALSGWHERQMRGELGHNYQCSAVRGMEHDCHCGWLHLRENTLDALTAKPAGERT